MKQTVRTVCDPNCHATPNCGLAATVENGKIIAVEPAEFPVEEFNGRICLMGRARLEYQYHPDRLRYPLKRVGNRGEGQWQRISWDEAIDLFIENQRKTAEQYGPTSVAFTQISGAYGLLTRGAPMRYASLVGGTIMRPGGIDYGVPKGLEYTFGVPASTYFGPGGHAFSDAFNSELTLIWGGNPVVTRSVDYPPLKEARRAGTRLICIDPTRSETAAICNDWISPRPGTDGALALGLLKQIFDAGKIDQAFIRNHSNLPFLVRRDNGALLRERDISETGSEDPLCWSGGEARYADEAALVSAELNVNREITLTDGSLIEVTTAFQQLSDLADQYPLERVAAITEIAENTIKELADVYMNARPAAIRVGFGIDRWYYSDLTARAIATLAVVTGNIGKPGAGISINSGGKSVPVKGRAFYAPDGKIAQMLSMMELDSAVLEGNPYPVKMECISLGNPFNQAKPNRNKVISDYVDNLDFIAVIDHFMTDTAKYADLVLPACTIFERTDLVVGPVLQLQQPAVEPEGEAKTDLEIFSLLAQKMGIDGYFDKTPGDYIEQMLDSDHPLLKDVNFEKLNREKVIYPGGSSEPYYGFKNLRFATPCGKIEIYNEQLLPYGAELPYYKEPVEASPKNPLYQKYPLVLLSAHSRFRIHSTFANLEITRQREPEPTARINSRDATTRGITDGDVIDVFNDRGRLKIRCRIDEHIRPGCILVSEGHWTEHYIEGDPYGLVHDHNSPTSENYAHYDVLVEARASS